MLAIMVAGAVTLIISGPETVTIGGKPSAAAVSNATGKLYVADQATDEVMVLDARTRALTGSRFRVGDGPSDVLVSPDGSWVFVANQLSDTVSVIDAVRSAPVRTIPVGDQPVALAISPDGGRLYVANAGANSVSVIDTHSDGVGLPVPVGARPSGLAVSLDGRRVYVANPDENRVSVIDTTAPLPTVITTIDVGQRPVAVATGPGGTGNGMVYVVNQGSDTQGSGTMWAIESDSGAVIRKDLAIGRAPSAIAVRPDGRRVYVVGGSRSMTTIDPITNTPVGDTVDLPAAPVDVAVMADNRTLMLIDQDPPGVSFRVA